MPSPLGICFALALMLTLCELYAVGLGPTCVECGGKLKHSDDCPANR